MGKVDDIMRRHARAKRSVLSRPLREYRGGDVIRLWFWFALVVTCVALGACILVGVLFGGCCLVANAPWGR